MLLNLFSGFNSQSTEVVPPPMPMTVYEWANYFAAEQSTVRQLFSETIKVIQMLLAVPASVASAERSFSCLRRLKTWLRRTMTQKRLTHLALLPCHRQRAENVDIEQLCKEFASKTNERRSILDIRLAQVLQTLRLLTCMGLIAVVAVGLVTCNAYSVECLFTRSFM